MNKYVPAITVITISLASMMSVAKDHIKSNTLTDAHHRTVTRNAPVHVSATKIPKFKLLRSNPHRVTHKLQDWDYDEIEDDAIISPYRRKDLHQVVSPNGINDHVRWQLFLARQAALLIHKQKWG
jgi:hypothetical protein